ncbi:GNAT family N-acetyltransferase [Nocardia sp. NBC_00881]|uniref:GNAT family N-acetyltransferase n=1 Tax=Nocardia sp. NBC_00881 TaxID=2975995 RepID=UPI00386B3D5A|nr:GNAT family N-acetyltransferase [Nocardia sp. NBC_00881]
MNSTRATDPSDTTPPVKLAEAGDLVAAAQLLVDFNREYDDPAPEPTWLAGHLSALIAGGDTSVLLVGEPAVGVAVLRFRTSTWSTAAEAYLAEFYVVPQLRGRGIGSAFLSVILDHARQRGATYIDLTTTDADHAARRVYEKHGFDCHEGRGQGPLSLYYELDLD